MLLCKVVPVLWITLLLPADAPDLASGAAGSASFKLFGDIEPLPLDLSGEVALAGSSSKQEQFFRLFGEIEPLELQCVSCWGRECAGHYAWVPAMLLQRTCVYVCVLPVGSPRMADGMPYFCGILVQ